MQRRILALVIFLALVALVLPAAVFGTTSTVTCTVSAGAYVGVSVLPGSVAYGTLNLNEIKNTAQYDADYNPSGMATPQTQTICNNGTVNEDFAIETSNAVGVTNWSLTSSGMPTTDEFAHAYYVSTKHHSVQRDPNP